MHLPINILQNHCEHKSFTTPDYVDQKLVELWLVVLSFTKVLNFRSNDLAALCHQSTTLMLCTTLAECPHLAIKVKSFIFTYPTMVYDGPEVHLDTHIGPQKYLLPLNAQAYSFLYAPLVCPSTLTPSSAFTIAPITSTANCYRYWPSRTTSVISPSLPIQYWILCFI